MGLWTNERRAFNWCGKGIEEDEVCCGDAVVAVSRIKKGQTLGADQGWDPHWGYVWSRQGLARISLQKR